MDFQEFNNYNFKEKLALLEKWGSEKDIEKLIMSFKDPNYEVSGKASELLISIGKPAIGLLLESAKSNNIDVRGWSVDTLGQIEGIDLASFLTLLKITYADHNVIVKNKAYHAIKDSLKFIFKKVKRIVELLFYYIFISIVQMACLVFIVAPIIILIVNKIPLEMEAYGNLFSIIVLSTAIPFISAYVASYVFKPRGKIILFLHS